MNMTLAPCPFCGSKDIRPTWSAFECWIHCSSCGCDGPLFEDENEAIKLRNNPIHTPVRLIDSTQETPVTYHDITLTVQSLAKSINNLAEKFEVKNDK